MAKVKDKQLYLRGGVWWARLKVENRTERISTGCRDYEAACLRKKELERRQADPAHHASSKVTFSFAADRLLDNLRTAGKSAGTINMHRTKAGHLLRVFKDCLLVEINSTKVDSYVSTRSEEGASKTTLSKELTTLRRVLKLSKHLQQFSADIKAIMPFDFSPEYVPRVRFLESYAELQDILWQLPRERAAHVCFMLATGARWSESVRAERADINIQEGRILIRGTKTKEAWRYVPVLEFFRPALNLVLETIPFDKKGRMFRPWLSAGHALPNACKRANVGAVTPNDLRRTAASWLRQAGIEPSLIAVFLGHKDTRMVETIYGKMPVDALGAAMRARLGEAPAAPAALPGSAPGGTFTASRAPAAPAAPGAARSAQERRETAPIDCARFVPAASGTAELGSVASQPRPSTKPLVLQARQEKDRGFPGNYRAKKKKTPVLPEVSLCPETESNCRHEDFQSSALASPSGAAMPTERAGSRASTEPTKSANRQNVSGLYRVKVVQPRTKRRNPGDS